MLIIGWKGRIESLRDGMNTMHSNLRKLSALVQSLASELVKVEIDRSRGIGE
jgi:hypothetical protein